MSSFQSIYDVATGNSTAPVVGSKQALTEFFLTSPADDLCQDSLSGVNGTTDVKGVARRGQQLLLCGEQLNLAFEAW